MTQTIFNQTQHQAEIDAVRRDEFEQMRILSIPTTDNGGRIIEHVIDANGVVILPTFGAPETGDTMQSSAVARLLIQVNNEKYPWLSYSIVPGAGDMYQITGSIGKLRIRILTPDAGKFIHFALLKGISFGGGSVSSGATYATPTTPAPAPTGGGGSTTTTVSDGGGSYTPTQTVTRSGVVSRTMASTL